MKERWAAVAGCHVEAASKCGRVLGDDRDWMSMKKPEFSTDLNGATRSYESWMRRCAPIIEKELRDKHVRMRRDPFSFLRGTYYRWAQLLPVICKEELKAPKVLSVADLHVDNFGTW